VIPQLSIILIFFSSLRFFSRSNISTWGLTSQTVFIVHNSRNNVGPRLSDSSTYVTSKYCQTFITINAHYNCITLHQREAYIS